MSPNYEECFRLRLRMSKYGCSPRRIYFSLLRGEEEKEMPKPKDDFPQTPKAAAAELEPKLSEFCRRAAAIFERNNWLYAGGDALHPDAAGHFPCAVELWQTCRGLLEHCVRDAEESGQSSVICGGRFICWLVTDAEGNWSASIRLEALSLYPGGII